jgi:tRNA(Ile)-lysidine synthase
MTLAVHTLLERLRDLQRGRPAGRYLVGFSGGLDSTVLLHALAVTRDRHGTPLVAVHVNHRLHPDAAEWERQCRSIAGEFGVEYVARQVEVADDAPGGLEAAAREARYGALMALMEDGDVLLSAHHEEDQAETLLLNLMRGSGLAGLAAIGASHSFGPGLLVRPLLGVSRAAIAGYAREFSLEWIDDPANQDLRFDRNFLRQKILPRLRRRWPAVSARLRQTSELASEAAGLLDQLARIDLAAVQQDGERTPDRLDIGALQRLNAVRQRNLLRHAIRACGLPQAPAPQLRQIQNELLSARRDAQPLVRWHGAEARRYRQKLYLLPGTRQEARIENPAQVLSAAGCEIQLGPTLGALRLERAGDDVTSEPEGLSIRKSSPGGCDSGSGRAENESGRKGIASPAR